MIDIQAWPLAFLQQPDVVPSQENYMSVGAHCKGPLLHLRIIMFEPEAYPNMKTIRLLPGKSTDSLSYEAKVKYVSAI